MLRLKKPYTFDEAEKHMIIMIGYGKQNKKEKTMDKLLVNIKCSLLKQLGEGVIMEILVKKYYIFEIDYCAIVVCCYYWC